MSIKRHTYTSGTNRGQRRVWLEGKRLIDLGIKPGQKFERSMSPDGTTMVLYWLYDGIESCTKANSKLHKVCGTQSRPIIDLNGAYITEMMGDCEKFTCTFIDERNVDSGGGIGPGVCLKIKPQHFPAGKMQGGA